MQLSTAPIFVGRQRRSLSRLAANASNLLRQNRALSIRATAFYAVFAFVLSFCSTVHGAEPIVSASEPVIKERRAHENRVEYVTTVQDDQGRIRQHTNSFVMLATGLNRWDAARNAWVPANNRIEMINGNGVARGTQHRVILAPNTTSAGGLIDLETPSGERIALRPVGLAVTDANGRSIFLAEVKESKGVLSDSNTMIYPDAFDLLAASIAVKISLDGVESDVILSERVDRNLLQDLGIEIETAKLEVWHEVVRKPRFNKEVDFIRRRFGRTDEDHTVEFGGMRISPGTAFSAKTRENLDSTDDLPVAKQFVRIGGTDFLIESVPFLEAETELKALPQPQHAAWSNNTKAELAGLIGGSVLQTRHSSRRTPISLASLRKSSPLKRQLAMAEQDIPKGYVIDYPITLATQTNFTFRGDTTYLVTNRVLLYGQTRLEGGAVIKTIPNNRYQPGVVVMGDFDCATSPLNPAIFTARDDNTVGEVVAGSTGVVLTNSWYAAYNLGFLGNPVQVHDLQSRHAQVGLHFKNAGPHSVWNVQVFRCNHGIDAINTTVHLRNVLLNQTVSAIYPGTTGATSVHAEHLTVDTATNLFDLFGTLYLTNSLLANVIHSGGANVIQERVEIAADSDFKTAGRGRHYLADLSTYRNTGTPQVSSEMRKILKETTTWAPSLLSGDITSNTTLTQVAARDIDLPDLGFHYYPLDYLASGIIVDAATLTLGTGVHIGAYGPNAFVLRNGAGFISEGDPRQMNALVQFNAAQSESVELGGPLEGMIRLATPVDRVVLRFTETAILAESQPRRQLFVGLTDSSNVISQLEVSHSHLANLIQTFRVLAPETISFSNNIIERCSLVFEQGAVRGRTFAPLTLSLRNNLLHKGSLNFVARNGNTPWIVKDNFFNGESLAASGLNSNFAPNFNAYRAGVTSIGGPNNQTDINPTFQEGPLGAYYFGSSGNIVNLVDAGSWTAAEADLAHFTTQPGPLTRDGTSIVDIGFHYATVDSSGGEPDTDGDGILDKNEDRNLNGRLDPGETSDLDRDTDLDGDSDPEELTAGTDPSNSRSLRWRGLSSWRFDGDTLIGVEGQQPTVVSNTLFGDGIDTRGLDLSSTNGPVVLQYRGIENNGAPNVSLTRGSFRFRLQAFWASNDPISDVPGANFTYRGVGPEEWVSLIETANIAVKIDPDGTNIVVLSRNSAGQTVTNLQGRILVDSQFTRPLASDPTISFWYDVLVTYSPEETKVFWGSPAEHIIGTGITPWDGNSSANQFISIGSAPNGTGKLKGILDDVVIYNVPGILQTNPWTFSAVAQTNPSALNLVWTPSGTNVLFDVKKRILGETNWGWLSGAIGTNILDTQVIPGQRYEYNLNSGFVNPIGVREPFGTTMTASLLGSAIESRGKVLLLIDETLQPAIQPDLNTFITNLVGDGWSVLQTNVPRHIDDYSAPSAFATNWFNITNRIAPAIRAQYAQFSNQLKHILIIGHVTVPYTGDQPDDGHSSPLEVYGSHRGAWASDLYYSDVDGLWRDVKNTADSSFTENWNLPGDGKLDEDYLPGNANGIAAAEIAVARIDFARMPAFAESETDLLKRYLQKNARYRHKQLAFDANTIGADLFNTFQAVVYADQIAAETASKFVPLKPAEQGDVFASPNSFVIGAQSSPGYVDRISDARPQMQTTALFAANATAPACAFYFLRSSFFQDWNLQNNFMKAILTPTNGGLAAGWFLSMGVWRIDPLAAGLELGNGWREVVNTQLKPFTSRQSARATQILGDSTLRYPVLAPVSGLASLRANGLITLNWTAPTEPNCTYNVYRFANGITSPPIRLNSVPLTVTTFTEPVSSRNAMLYMIRALKVTETGSGSFTNISQGVFIAR